MLLSLSTSASSKSSRATGTLPTRWATSTRAAGRPTKRPGNTRASPNTSCGEGFYPKAAALYKKLLKVRPDDEATQLQLAEISAKQGLLLDAKIVLQRRRHEAARPRRPRRHGRDRHPPRHARSRRHRRAHGRREHRRRDGRRGRRRHPLPRDPRRPEREGPDRRSAGRACARRSDFNPLRQRRAAASSRAPSSPPAIWRRRVDYLDRETAGTDPALLMALAEIELKLGHLDDARTLAAPDAARRIDSLRMRLVDLAWSLDRDAPGCGLRLRRRRRRRLHCRQAVRRSRGGAAGVRRRGCPARSVAAEVDRGLRGRRPRVARCTRRRPS